jgi:microcystin-dependent protein
MRDLIDAPRLNAFADNEGSTFTVRSAEDADLVLDEVDTSHNHQDDWEQCTLIFRGPAEERVESGIHRLDHPRLDAFDVDLRPVQVLDPDPDGMQYQTSITRHVPDREPQRPYRGPKQSRRGFFGKVAAALGGAGLLGGLMQAETAKAESTPTGAMSTSPFIGQMMMVPYIFAPQNWAFCNGQTLPISSNTALFSLLGTQFGGDGQSNFKLPDLRGRVPMHAGNGPGLSPRRVGDTGGSEEVALSQDQMPNHNHGPSLPVSTSEADATTPDGNALGAQPSSRGTVPVYSSGTTDGSMSVESTNAGGAQAHPNMPPFVAVHVVISLQGVYPTRG